MACFYTVVRYVPDPLAEERLNIGVIVFGPEGVRTRFTRRWQRVRGFGSEDVTFLRTFVQELEASQHLLPLFEHPRQWDEQLITGAINHWRSSIQFSEPKGSTQSPDVVLRTVADRFLRESARTPVPRARDKRAAISLGLHQLRNAVEKRFGEVPESLVQRLVLLPGKHEHHTFDIVVRNGHLVVAAQALSFEGRDASDISKDVDAIAWSIDDVKKKQPKAPAAVLVLPPKTRSKYFDRLDRLSQSLDFSLVKEIGFTHWAQKIADKVDLPDLGRLPAPAARKKTLA